MEPSFADFSSIPRRGVFRLWSLVRAVSFVLIAALATPSSAFQAEDFRQLTDRERAIYIVGLIDMLKNSPYLFIRLIDDNSDADLLNGVGAWGTCLQIIRSIPLISAEKMAEDFVLFLDANTQYEFMDAAYAFEYFAFALYSANWELALCPEADVVGP